MTHTSPNDEHAALQNKCGSGLLLELYAEAADRAASDLSRNLQGAVKAFTQLWKLMEAAAEVYGHENLMQTPNARSYLACGRPEAALRKTIEDAYRIPLVGITDVELRTYGPRLRARLNDFCLAEGRKSWDCGRDLNDLRSRFADGRIGGTEAIFLYEAQKLPAPTSDKPRPTAQVISLDRWRSA